MTYFDPFGSLLYTIGLFLAWMVTRRSQRVLAKVGARRSQTASQK